MNKVATISLAGAGGLLLFSAAYLGFAKMNHVPLHTLPVFGSLFPAPPEPEEAHGDEQASETHADESGAESTTHASDAVASDATHGGDEHGAKPAPNSPKSPKSPKSSDTHETKADVLGMFQFDSPYSADELRELVATLQRKNQDVDHRMSELSAKEEIVADRLEALEDRQKVLDAMKLELEELQAELAARAEELDRSADQKAEEERKSVKALGALFEDGEVDALATRLVGYGPKEAAKILATLAPDRAKELLDALPQPKWREFAEAYTKAVAAPKTK